VLPIRIHTLVVAGTPSELELAADRLRSAGGRVDFLGVKMFGDGSLGGHTAAMREPFADRPDQLGTHRLDPAWAAEMARAAVDLGGRVAVHAIGDAANDRVLDLMETLIAEGIDPAVLRIEHASVLTPDGIDRFGRTGVTACVQPAFLASEVGWLERRLGPERLAHTYAFRSLAGAGAPLAGSSDSPVEPPHPLWGMAAARDRCGMVPAEALPAEDAFRLFTAGAAAAIGESALLAPGHPADLTVLEADPVETGADDLRRVAIRAVFVEGERVPIPDGITAWQA
jgi:predicted amidohydrolase YtcJ